MTAGERIKKVRKDAGLTQAQLAEKLNIPYQSIGQWERNIRKPKTATLAKIATALGLDCDYYWLIFGDDWEIYDKAAQNVMRVFCTNDFHIEKASKLAAVYTDQMHKDDGYSFSKSEKELISCFSALNDLGQREAMRYLKLLSETPQYQRPQEPDDDKK